MKSYTAQSALIKLYLATRKAPLPLEEHDECRACVDVLAQVLNIKLDWVVPVAEAEGKKKPEDAPVAKVDDIVEVVKEFKRKKRSN